MAKYHDEDELDYDEYDYDEYDYEEAPRKRPSSGKKKTKKKSSSGRPSPKKGTRKMTKKERAKKRKRRIILFIFEILLLLIMLGVLWLVTRGTESGKVVIPEEEIEVNEEVKELEALKGYWNIALFGVDSTTGALSDNTRSDSIMIASINQDTKEVKLMSVYRDTFLNIGNDTYNKANTAYAKGGPKQAMSMLNQNLDLQITDFVTIGFAGLIDAIDKLGGVSIDVTSAEISHLNNYQYCIAENLKRKYVPVKNPGEQVLDGLQATGYCRIRYTKGDDFKRAERQRTVLKKMMEKAKTASVAELTGVANSVFDQIYTSFGLTEIVELLGDVSSYSIVADDGFPKAEMRAGGDIGSKGNCVVPADLESNVSWLHEFLFDEKGYDPTKEVKSYSDQVKSETSKYLK